MPEQSYFRVIYLDNLSNILTSFWASYSFCSSVISSMGFGIGSSTWPVMGLILEQARQKLNACQPTDSHVTSNRNKTQQSTHKGFADLYSSVSESSSSEYWVSPLPPARRPRATRSPAAFPYPVYFNRLSTTRGNPSVRLGEANKAAHSSTYMFLQWPWSPTHHFLCREQRGTLQRPASHPCQHVSSGEPACSWWLCRFLAWSLHLLVEEGPTGAETMRTSPLCSLSPSYYSIKQFVSNYSHSPSD